MQGCDKILESLASRTNSNIVTDKAVTNTRPTNRTFAARQLDSGCSIIQQACTKATVITRRNQQIVLLQLQLYLVYLVDNIAIFQGAISSPLVYCCYLPHASVLIKLRPLSNQQIGPLLVGSLIQFMSGRQYYMLCLY